ncbi:MAG: PqqD family protein [Clostridia bacterium]|nr:PqqD family protein [Clostridia bacterium]
MKRKEKAAQANYLERIPKRCAHVSWTADEKGIVTLAVENKGWANRLAQVLFLRPKISYIHLDELGSFVWPLIDGKTSLEALGAPVEEAFGEKAQPLYPRLAQYFRILDSYGFIEWEK